MTTERPLTAALERVRAGRNPLYRSGATTEPADDRQLLSPLLTADPENDGAMQAVVNDLASTAAGRNALSRHLADVAALSTLDDDRLAGRVLRRTYGR